MKKIYHVLEHLTDFDPSKTDVNYRLFILGCGGTGGYVAQHVAQIRKLISPKSEIFLIDPDIVESKNLNNQLFVEKDIGKTKASVLKERYTVAYNMRISIHDAHYIETLEQLNEIVKCTNYIPTDNYRYKITFNVIIGCVDNNFTRRLINQYFNQVENIIYIDAGVEGGTIPQGKTLADMSTWTVEEKERYIESGYVGQVCVGVRANGKTILPPVCEVFPNLLIEAADELKPSESCSSLLQSEPQRLITNRYAALVIAGYINELFSTDTIRNHYTVFNSRDNSSSPSPLPTEEDLEIFKAIQEETMRN